MDRSRRPERVVNSGVIISGGTVNGPVAAGPGARAEQVRAGPGDAIQRIEQLLADLEAQAGTLPPEQAGDVIDDVGRLRAEVRHRRPSAEGIRLILARLAKAAAGTAAMLANVEQIRELVTQLLR